MRIKAILSTLLALWLPAAPLAAQDAVRRLTQDEAVKAAVAKPQPDYPPVAKQLKIQGRVEVELSIDPSGTVENVKVLSGNPALTTSTINTLKHWSFKPILSDGKPVRAVVVLSFTFRL